MSQPSFPTINPPLTREDVINQIISSIAMEANVKLKLKIIKNIKQMQTVNKGLHLLFIKALTVAVLP